MRAPPPGQAIYISKGDQDHGPFSFEELVERMGKGQFAPTDLSWHQGVSNWMALEQLPEWPTIWEKLEEAKKDEKEKTGGKGSVPPPAGEAEPPPPPAGPSLFEEVAKTTEKVGTTAPPPSGAPEMFPKTIVVETTQASVAENKSESSGTLNKILVGMAILFFMATVGFAGFILYKNWDKLGL